MVTLVINEKLYNLNDYTKACRTNKYVGASMKKKCERIISSYIMQQLKGVSFENKVKLSFRWYEKDKRRDLDNICFSKKFILDALVNNNIITTDSWKGVAGFTDEFFIDKNGYRVEVDIEEVK
jgi:Holliday junction resolvase RusA-like endonuclease